MKFKLYVPIKEGYENIVSKYFIVESVEYTNDIGAKDFPIYIIIKK